MKTTIISLFLVAIPFGAIAQHIDVPAPFQGTVSIEISSLKPLSGAREPILSVETLHLSSADSARFIEARGKDKLEIARPSSMAGAEGITPDAPVLCYIQIPGEDVLIPVRLVGLTPGKAESIDSITAAAPSYLEREVIKLLVHTRKEEFDGYISRLLGDRPTSATHPGIGVPYRAHISWVQENL